MFKLFLTFKRNSIIFAKNIPIIMYGSLQQQLQTELQQIKDAGLYKKERIIVSPQGADIRLNDGKEVVNFCANNYLGLSSHPRVIDAAKKSLDTHGFGMSRVRFICGTQDIHKTLEAKIADLYSNLCSTNKMPSFQTV